MIVRMVAYPFPRENIRYIHQRVMIRQRNRFHFVHYFNAKFIRIDAKLVQQKLFQIGNGEYSRTL